jgi:hypothetical protein
LNLFKDRRQIILYEIEQEKRMEETGAMEIDEAPIVTPLISVEQMQVR